MNEYVPLGSYSNPIICATTPYGAIDSSHMFVLVLNFRNTSPIPEELLDRLEELEDDGSEELELTVPEELLEELDGGGTYATP